MVRKREDYCLCSRPKTNIVVSEEMYTEITSLKVIKMEVFVKYARDYFMAEKDFIDILDKCKIPYKMIPHGDGYRWYEFIAEGKEFHIGFAYGNIFSYHSYY